MKIGISGNRDGLTEKSEKTIRQFLKDHQIAEIHHGGCVGIDAAMHRLAQQLNIKVVIHPPSLAQHRAKCKTVAGDQIRPQKPFLTRNRQIVKQTEMLIAFPPTEHQVLRSGTWSTIRYARKMKKPRLLIFSSGESKAQQEK